MRKTALTVLILAFVMGILAMGAYAEEAEETLSLDVAAAEAVSAEATETAEFDFIAFAKERVLQDFHPTVKVDEAQADFDEKPFKKEDGIIRARVGIFYKGWLRQHSMLIEMDYRPEDRKVRVSVLKDTNGMNLQGARFFKEGEWVSLAAMGWK